MDKHFALLSLGSNMGDRKRIIEDAIDILKNNPEISDFRMAGLYETEPVGYENQDYFLNTCVCFNTSMNPYELLEETSRIEQLMHRERLIHWGPRTLDIDIILYDDLIQDDPKLTIPHPRYKERAFVLIPMSELVTYDGIIPEDKSVKPFVEV